LPDAGVRRQRTGADAGSDTRAPEIVGRGGPIGDRFRSMFGNGLGISEGEFHRRQLPAADYIPADRLGTCDDCGFRPFADDDSTSRDIAFAEIASRVTGTGMAEEQARAS
jgi:hypothetical protein